MKTPKEKAQDNPASAPIPQLTAEQAKLQRAEEEHWETLLSLLAQSPAAVLPAAATGERSRSGEVPNAIAAKPLLKSEPAAAVSIKITRSTAEQYPLPSNVPSTRHAEPAAMLTPKQTIQEQAIQEKAQERTSPPAEPRQPVLLPERITESWTEKLSQHIRATFDVARASHPSSIKPTNQAEVAYNPDGHVDYVTYTINAPTRKRRREPLT